MYHDCKVTIRPSCEVNWQIGVTDLKYVVNMTMINSWNVFAVCHCFCVHYIVYLACAA